MSERYALENFLNQYIIVEAVFNKYDTTRDGRAVALLLDVKLSNNATPLTDHIWINRSSAMKKLDLEEGEIICFETQVTRYAKGSDQRGWKESFGFKNVKNISRKN